MLLVRYFLAIDLPVVICTVGCVIRIIRIVEGGWQLVIRGDVLDRRLLAFSMSSDSSIRQDGEMEVIRVQSSRSSCRWCLCH